MSRARVRPCLLAACILLIGGFVSSVIAAPVIMLPLDGYYRPGKFFPVRVTSDRPVTVRIEVENGVSARGVGESVTLPVMLLSPATRSIRLVVDDQPTELPIRPLEANQRLVLCTQSNLAEGASELFPGTQIVPITLPLASLSTLGLAYESVDAVLLDEAASRSLETASTSLLPACGMTVAIQVAPPTASEFDWKRVGRWSVIDYAPRGPLNSMNDSRVSDATVGFIAARQARVRAKIWLAMAMFSIFTLAACLLRRRAVWGVVVVAAIGLIAGGWYEGKQSPVTQRVAIIQTPAGTKLQANHQWIVRSTLAKTNDEVDFGDFPARPVFTESAEHAAMWIDVQPDSWRYHYALPWQGKMVFVRTVFTDVQLPANLPPAEPSLFSEIARQFYIKPGERIAQAGPSYFVVESGPKHRR